MFCAEFEMNYKVIGVIILKKCCVSAYAKYINLSSECGNIYTDF
ncbi:hypothetical protein LAD12857_26440 [Lacrimispora amygdalina]|uniref:Uncharacterized protein n=1 Tax=Lacrimispora amygdalina TaxID=253257 RepID=A0ABQ5M816_9FIRM